MDDLMQKKQTAAEKAARGEKLSGKEIADLLTLGDDEILETEPEGEPTPVPTEVEPGNRLMWALKNFGSRQVE